MSLITENILSAIDIIVDKKIDEAAYDRALVATVIEVLDTKLGKYRLKYQDSTIEAIAITDTTYRVDDLVYVLIPGNDSTQEKLILGMTSGSKSDPRWEDLIIGGNALDISFSTNLTDAQVDDVEYLETVVYDYQNLEVVNDTGLCNMVVIDQQALQESIKAATSLVISAHFKCTVADDDPRLGNYGLKFEVALKDGSIQTYVFDTESMNGDVYKFIIPSKQTKVFEGLDGNSFNYINKITWFIKDFKKGAIVGFKNLQIHGGILAPGAHDSAVQLKLFAPSGTVFESIDESKDLTLPIQARLMHQGKYISDSSVEYYFFVEDPFESSGLAGDGWSQILIEDDINIPDRVLSEEDFPSYSMMLKCIAKYGGWFYSNELLFQNTQTSSYNIIINRNIQDTTYSLKTKIITNNQEISNYDALTYRWIARDINGNAENKGTVRDIEGELKDINSHLDFTIGVKNGSMYLGSGRIRVINTLATAAEKVVKDAIHYYAVHNSDIEAPESWSTIKPSNIKGYYLWSKIKYIYTDGTSSESEPMVDGISTSVAVYTYDVSLSDPVGSTISSGWSLDPLSPNKDNPEVYVSYGLKVNGDYLVGQDWTEKVLFSRYSEGVDGENGKTIIYRYAFKKTNGLTDVGSPEGNWDTLEGTDIANKWCKVSVDLNRKYPFVYSTYQIEIQQEGAETEYSAWAPVVLDRHWGEDYIYGYGYNETAVAPSVDSNGEIIWTSDWSSAELPISKEYPYVYRITGIIEGDILQPLDTSGNISGYWTSPVLYKNYSLNLTLTSTKYGVSLSGNLDGDGNPPTDISWNDVYPDLEDNEDIKGKYIWTEIIYSDGSKHYESVYIAKDGAEGLAGSSAKDLVLKSNTYTVKKNKDGSVEPNSITLTAISQNIEPTGYTWTVNGTSRVETSAILTLSAIEDIFENNICTISVVPQGEGLEEYKDETIINYLEDGIDAYTIVNSNPSMIFNQNDEETTSESATIQLFKGVKEVSDFTIAGPADVSINGHTITIERQDIQKTTTFEFTLTVEELSFSFKINCALISDGESVKDLTLHSSAFVVKKTKAGKYEPETISFWTTTSGLGEAPVITWDPAVSEGTIFSKVLFADGTKKEASITASAIVDEVEYVDTTTIVLVEDGNDAYAIANSNPSMVFNKEDDDTTIETSKIEVYKGSVKISNFTINGVNTDIITIQKPDSTGYQDYIIVFSDPDTGAEVSLTTTISWTVVSDGKDGTDGEPGAQGEKGDTVIQLFAYQGFDKLPETTIEPPVSGSMPSGAWSSTPSNQSYIYISQATKTGNIIGDWTDPVAWKVKGSDANVTLANVWSAIVGSKSTGTGESPVGLYYANKTDNGYEDVSAKVASGDEKNPQYLLLNASVIKTGVLDADLMTAGTLVAGTSQNGDPAFEVPMGELNSNNPIKIGGFNVTSSMLTGSQVSLGKTYTVTLGPGLFSAGVLNDESKPYFYVTPDFGVKMNYAVLQNSEALGLFVIRESYNDDLILAPHTVTHNENTANWDDIIAVTQNKDNYLLKVDAENIYAKIDTVYTKDEINGETGLLKNYYTKDETDTAIAEAVEKIEGSVTGDLTNYLKKDDDNSDNYIINLVDQSFASTNEVTTYVAEQLKDYYNKTEVDNTFAKKSSITSLEQTITTEVSALNLKFNDYYTKSATDLAISTAIANIDLSNYYTKSETYSQDEVQNLIQNSVGYVLNTAVTV